VADSGISRKRLLGIDRSGPPPAETGSDQPLRPWTVPNAIGYIRAACIPVFLIASYSSPDGQSTLAVLSYFIAGAGDYLDGIAARATGQYSRLGAMLDPVLDRLLLLAGGAVCWSFELLPRWALAVLLARELLMLAMGPLWLRLGLELRINWAGRIGVAPAMFGIFLAVAGAGTVGAWFLYVGVTLAWLATLLYLRSGLAQLHARNGVSSSA
jgi:cardiolipin synthase